MRALYASTQRQRALYAEQSAARLRRQTQYLLQPIEAYMTITVRADEMQPGRQAVLRWEECRRIMLDRKRQRLNRFRLTAVQMRLMNEERDTMVRLWYDNDDEALRRDAPWLRHTIGYVAKPETFIARFPRRAGKTMVATMVSAITMLSQKDGNVMSLNPFNQQAIMCLEQVNEHLEIMQDHLTYGYDRVAYSKSDMVVQIKPKWLRGECINEYRARGGASMERTAQNLRGLGKRLMMLHGDENEFWVDAAYVVSIPLLRYNAGFVLTSSANAHRTEAAGKMLQAQFKDGQLAVTTLDYRTKCNECMSRPPAHRAGPRTAGGGGGADDDDDDACPHIITGPTDHLSSVRSIERMQALMEHVGDYDIELGNAPRQAKGQPVFKEEDVHAAFGFAAAATSDVRAGSYPVPNIVYVALDPGTISERSVTAIVSFFMTPVIGVAHPSLAHEPVIDHYCVVRLRARALESTAPVSLEGGDELGHVGIVSARPVVDVPPQQGVHRRKVARRTRGRRAEDAVHDEIVVAKEEVRGRHGQRDGREQERLPPGTRRATDGRGGHLDRGDEGDTPAAPVNDALAAVLDGPHLLLDRPRVAERQHQAEGTHELLVVPVVQHLIQDLVPPSRHYMYVMPRRSRA